MIPLESMQFNFMQMALLTVLAAAPVMAVAGIQVVNCRMAFFADAVSHSAFAGAALGLLFFGANGPLWTMPLLAVVIACAVMWLKRATKLSTDTVIGVFFALVISVGLLLLSRQPSLARWSQMFIFGDILTVQHQDITILLLLDMIYILFTIFFCNTLQIAAVDEDLANAHKMPVTAASYLNIILLAMIVIMSVKAIGVLLVSAMLIVPAAAARNFARRAGSVYFYAVIIGLVSGITGLFISAAEWANTAAGATVVLINCLIFAVSCTVKFLRGKA
jgi:zinc transport system permease protein